MIDARPDHDEPLQFNIDDIKMEYDIENTPDAMMWMMKNPGLGAEVIEKIDAMKRMDGKVKLSADHQTTILAMGMIAVAVILDAADGIIDAHIPDASK